MDFAETLRAFDAHLQAIGRSDGTRADYRYELTRYWCDWIAPRALDPLSPGVTELEAYLASLEPRGSKRGSASRALKAFYTWASTRSGTPNPASHIHIPRPRVGPAPALAERDVRALLRAAFRKEHRRGWAIMLCLATGARLASFAAVLPEDVDLERAWITFTVTKGDRPYGVPLNRAGLVAARNLLSLHRDTLIGSGPAAFRVWVHQAERDAGLGRIWPHLLRHEFSNRVAARGDPEAWRKAMNHTDLSQWARYVAAGDERLRAAVRR